MSSDKVNSAKKKSRCEVENCTRNPNVSVHRMPKNNFYRKQWMKNLKLTKVCEPFFVCDLHFVEKDFCGVSRRCLSAMAVPSVNLPETMETVLSLAPSENGLKLSADEGVLMESILIKPSTNDVTMLDNGLEPPLMETSINYVTTNDDREELIICIDTECEREFISDEDNQQFLQNETEAFKYHDQLTQMDIKYADKCIQANLAYDKVIRPWTLLEVLQTNSDLQSWTGGESPKILVVFVLTKLKTNLTFKHLACLFSLTPDTLASYFDKFVPILKTVLKPAIFWPTKEQIYNNLPKCFKPQFEDCFALMDCNENPIQRLKSLESRKYSYYKGTNTAKINILTAPAGIVIEVSKAYGGKALDKHIVLKEKVIDKMSAGNGIMVDKGYDIRKETFDKGVKLYRPPILDKPQLSREDAIYITSVATSRIHVERVIQRLKKFDVFNTKMDKSMLKHIDDIVFILCAITNLSSPILADDKF